MSTTVVSGRCSCALKTSRRYPPTGAVIRKTAEPLTCAGIDLQPGQFAFPSLRSACRDAKWYEEPDRFELTREIKKQFAFGAGPHLCLGMHLARMSVAVGLGELRSAALRSLRPATWGGAAPSSTASTDCQWPSHNG